MLLISCLDFFLLRLNLLRLTFLRCYFIAQPGCSFAALWLRLYCSPLAAGFFLMPAVLPFQADSKITRPTLCLPRALLRCLYLLPLLLHFVSYMKQSLSLAAQHLLKIPFKNNQITERQLPKPQ
jgi:O-antigen ligase